MLTFLKRLLKVPVRSYADGPNDIIQGAHEKLTTAFDRAAQSARYAHAEIKLVLREPNLTGAEISLLISPYTGHKEFLDRYSARVDFIFGEAARLRDIERDISFSIAGLRAALNEETVNHTHVATHLIEYLEYINRPSKVDSRKQEVAGLLEGAGYQKFRLVTGDIEQKECLISYIGVIASKLEKDDNIDSAAITTLRKLRDNVLHYQGEHLTAHI